MFSFFYHQLDNITYSSNSCVSLELILDSQCSQEDLSYEKIWRCITSSGLLKMTKSDWVLEAMWISLLVPNTSRDSNQCSTSTYWYYSMTEIPTIAQLEFEFSLLYFHKKDKWGSFDNIQGQNYDWNKWLTNTGPRSAAGFLK